MDKQIECVSKISKSGRNMFARIPDHEMHKFCKKDKVKVILIERAHKNEDQVREHIKKLMESPAGEKVTGIVNGVSIVLPIATIINNMPKAKAEKILFDAIMGD